MDIKKFEVLLKRMKKTKDALESINKNFHEANMLLIVLPVLEYLGWKVYEGDFLLEGRTPRPVDICLLNKNRDKYEVLIELKKRNIGKNQRKQLSEYMVWSKTRYGVLINKDALELFAKRFREKDDTKKPYQQYQCFILPWLYIKEYYNVLNLISKNFISKGKTDSIIKKLYPKKNWDEYFDENIKRKFDPKLIKKIRKKGWDYNEETIKIRLEYIEKLIPV
jgi:hypothetical protein